MESNKPLSVHMTHEEYEQYKRFLKLTETPTNKLFVLTKRERYLGRFYDMKYTIYSESEIKEFVPKLISDKIAQLEEKIKKFESRKWYHLW